MFQKTCENWGMNWYDSGKLMAMAPYANQNLELGTVFSINDNDVRDVKLNGEYNSFQEKANFCKWLQEYIKLG